MYSRGGLNDINSQPLKSRKTENQQAHVVYHPQPDSLCVGQFPGGGEGMQLVW